MTTDNISGGFYFSNLDNLAEAYGALHSEPLQATETDVLTIRDKLLKLLSFAPDIPIHPVISRLPVRSGKAEIFDVYIARVCVVNGELVFYNPTSAGAVSDFIEKYASEDVKQNIKADEFDYYYSMPWEDALIIEIIP